MKSVNQFIKRFISILFFSSVAILIINIALLFFFTENYANNSSPYGYTEELAGKFRTENGRYVLSADIEKKMTEQNYWAVIIENDSKKVVWQSKNLPNEIPKNYSISDIAELTRGYVKDYPTYTANCGENDLLVVGTPKDSFVKHMWPSWDYYFIKNMPKFIVSFILVNLILLFAIYMFANMKLLKSIKPIVNGINDLADEKSVYLKEKGVLAEIAAKINNASEILQYKNRELRRKETARANWIAGVSHDIRTPLSMILGYADQLKNDKNLGDAEKNKASVICIQSIKIKNLINDLNLASKLEYNMQPLKAENINLLSVARQTVAEFINSNYTEKYDFEFFADNNADFRISADTSLIKRAISNLIQNSCTHNPDGCKITISLKQKENAVILEIKDNGIGADSKTLEKLKNQPHYMMCDGKVDGQRHGLGLQIVQQIMEVHNGSLEISGKSGEYFSAKMIFNK